jgi:hypothetical protein
MEGEFPPLRKETPGNHIRCPGSGQRMLWTNFGNRPNSDPYPACAVCERKGLDFDHMFRAEAH